jgi:carboxymethylenebutenolidase
MQAKLFILTKSSRFIHKNQTIEERGVTIMNQKINDLYDQYTNGVLDRREFLLQLTILAGSVASANALLLLLENNHAEAGIIPKDDPRINTEYTSYPGETGNVRASLARPKGDAKLPGVIVVHENKGLEPHIEDVNRRMALEGFLAMAPDALSPLGGTPDDLNEAKSLMRKLDHQSTIKNYTAAVKYLKTHPKSTGKVGVIGFCWGGGVANQMAVNSADLVAAVPFYGNQPASEDVPKIKASLLLHYAGNDQRTNKGIPAFEAALKAASVDYKMYMYEGVKHAFHDDTRAGRYNKEAAQLAWKRTISFLKEKLKE